MEAACAGWREVGRWGAWGGGGVKTVVITSAPLGRDAAEWICIFTQLLLVLQLTKGNPRNNT